MALALSSVHMTLSDGKPANEYASACNTFVLAIRSAHVVTSRFMRLQVCAGLSAMSVSGTQTPAHKGRKSVKRRIGKRKRLVGKPTQQQRGRVLPNCLHLYLIIPFRISFICIATFLPRPRKKIASWHSAASRHWHSLSMSFRCQLKKCFLHHVSVHWNALTRCPRVGHETFWQILGDGQFWCAKRIPQWLCYGRGSQRFTHHPSASRRRHSRVYYVQNGPVSTWICKNAFLRIHSILPLTCSECSRSSWRFAAYGLTRTPWANQ